MDENIVNQQVEDPIDDSSDMTVAEDSVTHPDGTVYYTTRAKVVGSRYNQIRLGKRGPRTKNLKGRHFGLLVVERYLGRNGYDNPVWGCLCKCGNRTAVTARSLVTGNTKSCGCLQRNYARLPWDSEEKQFLKRPPKKHPKLYALWRRIRYYSSLPDINSTHIDALREKNIPLLYKPWKKFEPFEEWAIENGWSEDKQLYIQRKDLNQGWFPDNCLFASKEMGGPKAGSKLYTYQGRTMCLSYWAKEFNMDYHTLQRRLNFCDGDIEKALQIPKAKYPEKRKSRKPAIRRKKREEKMREKELKENA